MDLIETKRPPRSRGFCVRMKLLRRNQDKIFCYRYFKWLLWFSISFYFFSSLIITHNKPITPLSRTTLSHSRASRALIEQPSLQSRSIFNGMKVYVYDLPAKYNTEWLANERCSTHLFASEVAIHRAVMSSEARTLDPFQADFFFVPVYVSCNFSKVNGFPAIGHARSLMASAVDHVSSRFPFWNRSRGADHVFVASHDFGSCFHTMV